MRFVFFFHFHCVIFFGMIRLMSFYNNSGDFQTKFPFYFRSQNNHFSFIHYSVGDGFFLRFQAFYSFKDQLMCFIFWIRLLRMWNAMLIFCLFFIIPISSYWFTSHTKTFWRDKSDRAIFSFSFSIASAFFSCFRFLYQFLFLQRTRQISFFVLKPKYYKYKMVLPLNLWMKLYSVTIQMKATEQ